MMHLQTIDGRPSRSGCKGFTQNCSISRLIVAVVLIACIAFVGLNFDAAKAEALLMWVQENKEQGSILFLGLYTAGVILMLPAMVMAMASGAIFGLVFGSFLAWVGSSIGQVISFVIGRYLLREIVLDYLSRQFPKWTAIDRAMTTEGWKLVTLLRLSPIAPWNVLNYGLSVTSVPLVSYAIASSLAILPYLVLFVYFGSLARNLADIFTGNAGFDTNTTIIMGIISGVVMIAIVWYTTHFSRKAISQALLSHSEQLPPELTEDADVVTLLGGDEPPEGAIEMTHLLPRQPGSGRLANGIGNSSQPSSPQDLYRGVVSPRGRSSAAVNDEAKLLSRAGQGSRAVMADNDIHQRSGHNTPTRSQSPHGNVNLRHF